MHKLQRVVFASALALAACCAFAADPPAARDAGPYVPSPQSVVADMLKLAEVGPNDFVIDLGSGDGRIVLTAAKVFGARGMGIEIKDELVALSNEAARREGIADRVTFVKQDLFKADVSRATVLTMYLLPDTVNMLRDKLLRELRPGTRVISHDYPLAGWSHDRYVHMDLKEKVAISGVTTTLIYVYVVPAKVAGRWRAQVPSTVGRRVTLDLQQYVNRISGSARIDGKDVPLLSPHLRGDRIDFRVLRRDGGYAELSGEVRRNRIEGLAKGNGAETPWSATREAR
jgi:protein-L-isoaspartate O-methyltransferase